MMNAARAAEMPTGAKGVRFSEEVDYDFDMDITSPKSARSYTMVMSPMRPRSRFDGMPRPSEVSSLSTLRQVMIGGATVIPITPVKPEDTFCWTDEAATPRTLGYCDQQAVRDDLDDDADGKMEFQAWMMRLDRRRSGRGGCTTTMGHEVALRKSPMNSMLMRRRGLASMQTEAAKL
mmetsp:Transcript_43726/g.103265  ORF Transcript_43726/g.103265 Transcript_43726/m.103265 type:complete len:177 (-) Transcript_43726:103-633(-)